MLLFFFISGVDGAPQASNFGYGPCAAPGDLGDGEVLVKNLYLSVDPAQVRVFHRECLEGLFLIFSNGCLAVVMVNHCNRASPLQF